MFNFNLAFYKVIDHQSCFYFSCCKTFIYPLHWSILENSGLTLLSVSTTDTLSLCLPSSDIHMLLLLPFGLCDQVIHLTKLVSVIAYFLQLDAEKETQREYSCTQTQIYVHMYAYVFTYIFSFKQCDHIIPIYLYPDFRTH